MAGLMFFFLAEIMKTAWSRIRTVYSRTEIWAECEKSTSGMSIGNVYPVDKEFCICTMDCVFFSSCLFSLQEYKDCFLVAWVINRHCFITMALLFTLGTIGIFLVDILSMLWHFYFIEPPKNIYCKHHRPALTNL